LRSAPVRNASRACFIVATAIGLVLAWRGGWPILAAGIAAAVAAMAYSGGPRPISYTVGDFVVWLFFGLVAVTGSTGCRRSPSVRRPRRRNDGRLPAAAVLVVNNYRDLEPDRAVVAPLAFCLWPALQPGQYAVLMLGPFACCPCWDARRGSASRFSFRHSPCRRRSAWCATSARGPQARIQSPARADRRASRFLFSLLALRSDPDRLARGAAAHSVRPRCLTA
jgi:hypothetical protein